MSDETAQPTFKIIKRGKIPVKTLAKIMRSTRNAQGLIPQIYNLMQFAQDKAVEAEVELGNEAARALGFPSRHELSQYCKMHKLGFECNDDDGEVRLFATVTPDSPVESSAPPAQSPTMELVELCRHCNERISFSSANQRYEHISNGGSPVEHAYYECGLSRSEFQTHAQPKERSSRPTP